MSQGLAVLPLSSTFVTPLQTPVNEPKAKFWVVASMLQDRALPEREKAAKVCFVQGCKDGQTN